MFSGRPLLYSDPNRLTYKQHTQAQWINKKRYILQIKKSLNAQQGLNVIKVIVVNVSIVLIYL